MGENVTLARAGAVATVTLDRPDRRNSLSDAMLAELGAAFTELRDDVTTRVVIVTGAPPVFSAGADAPGVTSRPRSTAELASSRRSSTRTHSWTSRGSSSVPDTSRARAIASRHVAEAPEPPSSM